MRILLHDYSGQSPRGRLQRSVDDAATFQVEGIAIGAAIDKYGFARRWFQERHYAAKLVERLGEFQPDAVISANAPPHVQKAVQRAAKSRKARFIFWLQDLYGEAAQRLLPRRLPLIGGPAARWLTNVEAACLRNSDSVVAITDDFIPVLLGYGVKRPNIATIENWSPLQDIAPRPKVNTWSERHGLSATSNFIYGGTLGLKHDPSLIVALAKAMADRPEARIVVASEGMGADYLKQAQRTDGLGNLILLPFQAFADLPNMLGAADVVLALLEPDAGVFSVPSKVLTYFAAGRPIVGAMPKDNLAARLIEREQAGVVVSPGQRDALVEACRKLLDDPALRQRMGVNGRHYAESHFAIGPIADRFLARLPAGVNSVRN